MHGRPVRDVGDTADTSEEIDGEHRKNNSDSEDEYEEEQIIEDEEEDEEEDEDDEEDQGITQSQPVKKKMDKKYDRLKQSVIPLNTTITIRH